MRNKIFLIVLLCLFLISFTSATIVLPGTSNYASTNTNVTQENLFTHLNLTDGSLVLYMPFDVQENVTNFTFDYSNNSKDGLLGAGNTSRMPMFSSTGGIYGGAYQFDGVNDYIKRGYNQEFRNNSFTVAGWVKFNDNATATKVFLGCGDAGATDNYLEIERRANKMFFGFYGDDLTGVRLTKATGEWWFITASWDKNDRNRTLYVNGVLDKSDISTGYLNITTCKNSESGILIGKTYAGLMNGSIDEVMIFNRTLSATEVAQLYNATYPRFYPVGEMNFTANNFGTNNTVNISIPNCQQYNGSLINFKVNDGSYSQLNSSCMFDNYNMTGDLTSASVVLQLNSTNNYFYSPVINGNITLNDWYINWVTTLPWINYNPINGTRSCFAFNSNKGGKFAYNYLPIVATNCTK